MADSAFCAFGGKISEKELTNIIKICLHKRKTRVILYSLLGEHSVIQKVILSRKASYIRCFIFKTRSDEDS